MTWLGSARLQRRPSEQLGLLLSAANSIARMRKISPEHSENPRPLQSQMRKERFFVDSLGFRASLVQV